MIMALASRLTDRDRQIALDCYEHRVLTTRQLARLHFTSERKARERLLELHRLGVLGRFRPPTQRGEGSAQHHWILDEAGAAIVAVQFEIERTELRWRRDIAIAIAGSSKLRHQLEVNEFFTRLAAELREEGGALIAWWGERRCRAALDGIVAPDGYGVLKRGTGQRLDFFLELDRGTEDHGRIDQKGRRYAKALRRVERDTVVLLAVPSAARANRVGAVCAESSVPIVPIVWKTGVGEATLPLVSGRLRGRLGMPQKVLDGMGTSSALAVPNWLEPRLDDDTPPWQ